MRRRARSKKEGASARGRRLAIRTVLIAVGAAVLLVVVHAAVASALLSGRTLRSWINTDPESTLLDYDEAVSRWPGQLRVKNLTIRGSDRNVQWIIRLREARVEYSVASLFAKRFRATRVRGSGLSFRLRNKLDPTGRHNPPLALLPPVPGFEDPPLRSVRPPAPQPADGNPWAIQVDDLSVDDFDEIWLDVYHHRGPARLQGGFFLRPGLLARIGPASIDFRGGDVRIGEDPVALGLTGTIAATIASYDPRQVHGSQVWDKISGRLRLDGRCESVRFLNYFLRASREPRLAGGAGKIGVDGSVEAGVGRGELRLTAREIAVKKTDGDLLGNADARVRISEWRVERGPVGISGSVLELTDVWAAKAGKSRTWWGRFDIPSGRVDNGLIARVVAKCRDARPLFTMFGPDLPAWTRKLLEMEGLSASLNVALRPSSVILRRFEATGGKFRIEGGYAATGASRRGAFLVDTGSLNVGVELSDRGTSLHLVGARDWFEKERSREATSPSEKEGAAPATNEK